MEASVEFARVAVLLLAISSLFSRGQSDELAFVQLTHRHGDRAPVFVPAAVNDTYSEDWPLGVGQLTGLGMAQLYELGKQLRQTYIDQEQFLAPRYNHATYNCRSTDVDRTLQSAASLLYGLFPLGTGPNNTVLKPIQGLIGEGLTASAFAAGTLRSIPLNFQPVPISTVPLSTDSLLVNNHIIETCKGYLEWEAQQLASAVVQERIHREQDLFSQLAPLAGFPLNYKTVLYIYDALTCYTDHGIRRLRFPSVSESTFARAQDFIHFELAISQSNESINCLTTGPYWQATNASMRAAIAAYNTMGATKPPPYTRFQHYSAHDTTVFPLLASLQIANYSQPVPYAGHLIFELRLGNANAPQLLESWYVRVSYQDVWRSLPVCGGAVNCTFPEFARFMDRCGHHPQLPADFCSGPAPTPAPDSSQSQLNHEKHKVRVLTGLLVTALALLVVVLVGGCWWARKMASGERVRRASSSNAVYTAM